jgi:hypothetical protein
MPASELRFEQMTVNLTPNHVIFGSKGIIYLERSDCWLEHIAVCIGRYDRVHFEEQDGQITATYALIYSLRLDNQKGLSVVNFQGLP